MYSTGEKQQHTYKDKEKYKVYITQECKLKLDWITVKYGYEIQIWLAGEIKDGKMFIDDLLLSKHTAGMADVVVTSKELIKMRQEYGDRCARIIGQFHSHVKMGCFWSQTDVDMQTKYSTNSSKDFCIFIVGSNGDYLCRLTLRKPVPIIVDDVELIGTFEKNEELESFKKDVKKKVTIFVPKTKGKFGNIGAFPKKGSINYGKHNKYRRTYENELMGVVPTKNNKGEIGQYRDYYDYY